MPGSRAASIDLPVPGGPTNSRLCEPVAAISSARLACGWPLYVGEIGGAGYGRIRLWGRVWLHLGVTAQARADLEQMIGGEYRGRVRQRRLVRIGRG